YGKDEVWDKIPKEVQQEIIDKKLKFYVIKAYDLAESLGLGTRINTIMQTAFFAISNIMETKKAVEAIKTAINKTYGKKGERIVKINCDAVDKALESIEEVELPSKATSTISIPPAVPAHAPDFVQRVTAKIIEGKGDDLPVSVFPCDGTWPVATSQYEKRNIALHIPQWKENVCIQCGQCNIVCPHGVIRMKIYDEKLLDKAPKTFKHTKAKGKDLQGKAFTIQIAPEDCTGCGVCVHTCPALEKDEKNQSTGKKAINMTPQIEIREQEKKNWEFFLSLPDLPVEQLPFPVNTIKGSQLLRPLFEFSGACAGCGETAYVRLMTQLFGDRALVANATGCSSIYGGNLPTTPYCVRTDGKGPVWTNSLFEDNAEIGFGMRLGIEQIKTKAQLIADDLAKTALKNNSSLINEILTADQSTHEGIETQRLKVKQLKTLLKSLSSEDRANELLDIADYLIKKSIWIVGGDGWAYDIGYGGLDHVLAAGKNVNVLVLDTGVYSNTGGQMSKATPMGAIAKFAAAGKPLPKKDLAMLAMTYGNIYVARIAIGVNPMQTIKAFLEAEKYDGPSIIIAYTHCIAHGINMTEALDQQKKAVASGDWILLRYNPELLKEKKNPLQLDSKAPSIPLEEYIYNENRFKALKTIDPERASSLLKSAQEEVNRRFKVYEHMSKMDYTQT
ncbi:MAG: pyruvate:ferredoxin (flavodoxin) oxidoreductase, partial [Candidatus Omnitrophica bacterium]|nr:pyruvate:ferredoxin (flavodoxin) oxidoreductase [Candidatus Omnitrophota bacterium]